MIFATKLNNEHQKGGKTVVIRLAVKRSKRYISNILYIRGTGYARWSEYNGGLESRV